MGLKEANYKIGVCCKQSEDFKNVEKYLKRLISLKQESAMDYNYTLYSVYMSQPKVAKGYKYYKNKTIFCFIKPTKQKYFVGWKRLS